MIKKMIMLVILIVGIISINIESVSQSDINIGQYNVTKDIRFIIVGDPHVNSSNTSNKADEKLRSIVNFINKSDVDFAVFVGDMTNDGTRKSNDMVKDILKNVTKPYYVVIGNHDIFISPKMFESYYGPMEHIENIKGYQLLFIGIYEDKDKKLHWSFDFDKADKNAPTLVFIHGPVKDLPFECIQCILENDKLLYAKSIMPELDKFTNLIGVYSGHVHYDSNQVINEIRYVTINGLVDIDIGKYPIRVTAIGSSDKVGYSIIKDNKSYYDLVSYAD